MHYNHLIFDSGLEKLQESGLDKRADIAKRHEGMPYLGSLGYCLDPKEYLYVIEELQERGFLKWDPDFADGFFRQLYSYNERMDPMRALICDKGSSKWQVELPEGVHEEGIDLNEDLGLFSGYFASFVLTPDEFWNPEKFGFDNLGDLWGTLGAYMKMTDRTPERRSYKYKSQVDGKTFVTEATGDMNGDFRLFRTDITPYKTEDPLGNNVSYRPELDSDRQIVSTYYGVEPGLLALAMKWANQEGLESKILQDPDKFLLEFLGQGKYLGNFADAGYDSFGPSRHFFGFNESMARLDKKDNLVNAEHYDLIGGGNGQNTFRVSVDSKGSLAFSFFKKIDSPEQDVRMRIPKQECDEFIRGLVIQTQMGLGRTSYKQMEDVIKYRFSEQFNKDRQEEQRFVDKITKK